VDITLGTFFPPPFDIIRLPRATTDLRHSNVYTYSSINFWKSVALTLGASGDFVEGEGPEFKSKQQFNPKLGIMWNPLPATTVRAAAFRVLKRKLVTDQTVEPTQVAGFNQFFDDNNGTEAWRYGGAIDQKFTKDFFGGIEFTKRDIQSPLVVDGVGRVQDMHEYLIRNYLFWTPHPWLALRAEYMFERFRNQGLDALQPQRLKTHRAPLGISLFHPSGVSVGLTATYFNQDGTFVLLNNTLRSGRDDFWTVDATISYRLPKRYGFIAVGATNLFDNTFKFFERDLRNPTIQPDRVFFARLTLALP
jgi:outer membrane receptor protein involved in Fe transport